MMIFLKIILYLWILMLSYRIINLYIERYLHYTLDYYINHEYNIYIQILFSFGIPKDKFQVTSLLRFYSHNLSFLIITLKIYLESSQVIWILIWIFFCLYSDLPRLEILGLSLNWKKIKIYEGGYKYGIHYWHVPKPWDSVQLSKEW